MSTVGDQPVDLTELLTIDPDGAASPYEQIRAGIVALVAQGVLVVGQRLPTVRAFASDLGLAPNTVARSYRVLEADGVIETRGRMGSFIKTGPDAVSDAAANAAVEFVNSLRAMGIDDESIITLVSRVASWS